MSAHTLLDDARSYLAGGFSLIPLEARGKKPALDWKVYQERRPTEGELVRWFYRTDRNLGIVAGRISGGLTVIDFDTHEGWEEWIREDFDRWLIPTVTTGKGHHVYVRTEIASGNRRFHDRQIDIRGEGGYVVAPPPLMVRFFAPGPLMVRSLLMVRLLARVMVWPFRPAATPMRDIAC